LLVLRCTVGLAVIVDAGLYLGGSGHLPTGPALIAGVGILCGLSLLAGFLTPFAAGLVALGAIGTVLFEAAPLPGVNRFETPLLTILVALVAISIVLLGPGALSVDARVFGRREIIIPPAHGFPKS